jgi:[acyl-carrier-protein] S-malonyltransferase
MGQDLYEASEAVQELFALAAETTGIDVKDPAFRGQRRRAQEDRKHPSGDHPGELGGGRISWGKRGSWPKALRDFSLGEYSALVYTGVLSAKDVFPLVKLRGELMAKACSSLWIRAAKALPVWLL